MLIAKSVKIRTYDDEDFFIIYEDLHSIGSNTKNVSCILTNSIFENLLENASSKKVHGNFF